MCSASMPNRDRHLTSHHAVEEAIRKSGGRGTLYVDEHSAWGRRLASLAAQHGVSVQRSSRGDLQARGGASARDVVYTQPAESRPAPSLQEFLAEPVADDALVLILDHISDPHNLGAMLRSADLFGVQLCLRADRRSAPLSDAAVRVSAGAAEHVRLATVANINQSITTLKHAGFWVFGADSSGVPAPQTDLRGRCAVVMGSEGKGLSALTAKLVDGLISVPTAGHIDSLNVSVACGILLYEIRRQQSAGTK